MTANSSESMNCDELVELATAYLEQVLDPEARAEFDLHVLECPGCENYLQQLLTTIDTLNRTSDDQLDPDFRQRLLQAFRDCQ
jgi:anti-sigma factor RsiW